jgi:uncharacterized membrane protein
MYPQKLRMKNKINKLFKKITFVHVLLIILILVVFFGLFKKEISFNVPSVKAKVVNINFPCKKEVTSPEWNKEYQELWNKCYAQQKYAVSCFGEATQILRDEKIPETIRVNTICTGTSREQWLWGFGKYWLKL